MMIRMISFFILLFFMLQTVLPADLIAAQKGASNSITSREFSKLYPSLPSIPQGINIGTGRNTQFYVHHLPDPVNVFNGNLFLAYQDVNFPFRGFPLEISRAYNSRGTVKGSFGYGWTSSLDVTLSHSSDGRIIIREWDGSYSVYFPDIHSRGAGGEKRFVASQPAVHYVVKDANGTFTRFLGNGKKEVYSVKGVLVRKEDAYGNGIVYSYDKKSGQLLSLSDTAGRSIKLIYTPHGLLKSVTDSANRTIQYEYDANNNLVGVKGFVGETTFYRYDHLHNLTEITQPDGTKIRNIYDEKRDLVLMQQGPGAKRTAYQYDFPTRQEPFQQTIVSDSQDNRTVYSYFLHNNKVSRLIITDPMNRRTISEYDDSGNVVKQVDPKGNITTYRYDNFSRIISITDPSGNMWEFGYGDGQCSKQTSMKDPEGGVVKFAYNAAGNITEAVDANGKSHHIKYNQKGDALKVVLSASTVWTYEYDKYGNIIRMINPEGGVFASERDVIGRIKAVTNPAGNRYQYHYDTKGRLVEAINPMDYSLLISYDAMDRIIAIADYEGRYKYEYNEEGNVTAFTDPEGKTIRFNYDTLSNRNKIIDAAGNEWRYNYDRVSRLVELVSPKNHKSRFEYDQADNITAYVNPLQERISFSYDKNNRMVKVEDLLGMSVAFQYNGLGKRIGLVDPEGRVTGYSYDKKGNIVSARNAANENVEYKYDSAGNVIEYNDGSGSPNKFQYDKNHHLVKRIEQLGTGVSYEYNRVGQIIRSSDADGREIKYTYNKLGLLTGIIPKKGVQATYNYNKKGQLIAASEGDASYRYVYNKAGYVTEVEDVAARKIIRYTYDSRYNRIKSEVLPDGIQTIYTHDTLSQLVSIKTGGNDEYRFEYDQAGRRSALTYPNKVKTTYRYDKGGRLIDLTTTNARNETINRESYSFRQGMFISAVNDKENKVKEYKYDQLNRLIEVKHPVRGQEAFAYDSTGKIISHSTPSETVSYAYNKAHQMVSAGDETYEYDRSGNLVQKKDKGGIIRYQYDARNRLSGALLSDGSKLSYRYDSSDRITTTNSGGERTILMYDGDYPFLKMDKSLRISSRLVYGPGFHELLGEEKGGRTQFFIANNLGSIVAVTNEAGEVVSKIDYTAFGKPLYSTGDLPPATFTGMPYQKETGLLLFKYRAYDPAHGRFLQQEPLGLMPAWQNVYTYAANNPVNMIDIYGLWSFYQWVGAAATAAVVGAAAVAAAPLVIGGAAVAGASAAVIGTVSAAGAALGTVGTAVVAGGAVAGGAIAYGTTKESGAGAVLETIGGATVGAIAGGASVFVGGALAGQTLVLGATEVGTISSGTAAAVGGATSGFISSTAGQLNNVSNGDKFSGSSIVLGTMLSGAAGGFGGKIFEGADAATQLQGAAYGAATDAWGNVIGALKDNCN